MSSPALPFVFEDQSGHPTESHFDDIYDRLFLRVSEQPSGPASSDASSAYDKTIMIYNMGQRWSRRRGYLHVHCSPSVVLAFAPTATLGTITYLHPTSPRTIPITKYLRKTSIFGG
jgi:hypothetical protein